MYDGITPTKFGQYSVAEPFRPDRLHVFRGEPAAKLKTVDHEPPVQVLDQEDLLSQGIDTSKLVSGAQKVDALGSCTLNAGTVSLAERLTGAGIALNSIALTAASGLIRLSPHAVDAEKFAIVGYHDVTDQTGQPSTEWPPTDCGSTGLYVCDYFQRERFITGHSVATDIHSLVSLLQSGTIIEGGPWFNSWFEPDAQGFVDGSGSVEDLLKAVSSGVAGGHERCQSAVERLTFNALGMIDPDKSHLRIRNSWSPSWGDHGSFRMHLSTYQLLGRYMDYKQFVVGAG